MEKKNILVTGFGPFAGHPINASWESVKLLPALWHHDQIELVIDEIPVSYDFVEKSATSLNVALIFLILRTHCVCTIRSSRPTKMFQVTGGQMESGGF